MGFPLPGDRSHRLQDGELVLPSATEGPRALSQIWYDGARKDRAQTEGSEGGQRLPAAAEEEAH